MKSKLIRLAILSISICIIIFIVFSLWNPPTNVDNRTELEIQQLIEKNKNKSLFLGFWQGMEESDFNRVIRIESNNGNLNNGKFILKLSDGSYFKDIPFSVEYIENSIELTFEENYWVEWDKSMLNAGKDGISKGMLYSEIENYLIRTFDEKYIEIDNNIWKSESSQEHIRVIKLYCNYWYYLQKQPDLNSLGINFPKFNVPPGGVTDRLNIDEKKGKAEFAHCKITIRYEMIQTYLEQEKEQKNGEKELKQKIEVEKKKIENQIKKNNNNL